MRAFQNTRKTVSKINFGNKNATNIFTGEGKVTWDYNVQNLISPNIDFRIPSSGLLLTYAARQRIPVYNFPLFLFIQEVVEER